MQVARVPPVQEHLSDRRAPLFALDVVFGRDARRGHDALAADVFARVPAPLPRVTFLRRRGRWQVVRTRALTVPEVRPYLPALLQDGIRAWLARRRPHVLRHGTLATRILRHTGTHPDRERLREVCVELANCLDDGRRFI